MIIVFDIGNTVTKGAFFDGDRCVDLFHLTALDMQSRERLHETVTALYGRYEVSDIGCVSVVPEATDRLEKAISNVFGFELKRLTATSPVPLKMEYETPKTLGADRLAAAVAAHSLYGRAPDGSSRTVIAVDAGTAVNYEIISAGAHYLGGAIAPGPGLTRNALSQGTAQLPKVDLEIPEYAAGRSTDEALRSGVMFGFLDSVRGMLDRLSDEPVGPAFVVITGGWAEWLASRIQAIDAIEKELVLHGARLMLAYGADA